MLRAVETERFPNVVLLQSVVASSLVKSGLHPNY